MARSSFIGPMFFAVLFVFMMVVEIKRVYGAGEYNPCDHQDSYFDYSGNSYASVRLCHCPTRGSTTPTCYGRSTWTNWVNNTAIQNAIKQACAWQFDAYDCNVANWIESYACPLCRCTSATNSTDVQWVTKQEDWGGRVCYGCLCQERYTYSQGQGWHKVSSYFCTWHSILFSQSESCPEPNLCTDPSAHQWSRWIENGEISTKREYRWDSSQNKHVCYPNHRYCNNGTLETNLSISQIRASESYRKAILKSAGNTYNLRACYNQQNLFEYTCQSGWTCACPSGMTTASGSRWSVVPQKNLYSFLSTYGLEFEYCQECRCVDIAHSSPARTKQQCTFHGNELKPIGNCPSSLTCKDQRNNNEMCFTSTHCERKQEQVKFPGEEIFTGDLSNFNAQAASLERDCGDPAICGLVGDNKCFQATINVPGVWRYDCTTKTTKQQTVAGTDKIQCCTTSANCDNWVSSCPTSSLYAKIWTNAFKCMFGDHAKSYIEALGKQECAAKELGVKKGDFFKEFLFKENSCSDANILKFMANYARCYCQYISEFYQRMTGTNANANKQYSRKKFTEFVKWFAYMLGDGGCKFEPTCDYDTGTIGGKIETFTVTATITMHNTTIKNTTNFATGACKVAGCSNANQATVKQTTRRRRLTGTTSYELTVAAATSGEQQTVKKSLDDGKISVAGGTVSTASTDNTTQSVASAAGPGPSPTPQPTAASNTNRNQYVSRVLIGFIMSMIISVVVV